MIIVEWKGGMAFEAASAGGLKITMDATPDSGGENQGPSPLDTLLSSLAACSAMDVVAILEKKQQNISSYRVEVSGERVPIGTWPRPFTHITIKHILKGEELEEWSVAQAVRLSDEKYCSVLATLRQSPTVDSEWEIE
jgi:putative redox protein